MERESPPQHEAGGALQWEREKSNSKAFQQLTSVPAVPDVRKFEAAPPSENDGRYGEYSESPAELPR